MGPRFAYFKGQIVPMEDAKISVMTQAFNYGTGVFGGMRGYWNADHEQMYIFRSLDHFKRLTQSAGMMRIHVNQTPEELTSILAELLRTEGYQQNCYIRPVAYKSAETLAVHLQNLEDDVTIFAMPVDHYVPEASGRHVCFSAWRRIDDNSIPARGKITGAYANSTLIKSDAMLAGYDDSIVLNNDGHVAEMSAANFMMVRDGVVVTPPINANVLEGIVRRSVIELCRHDLGIDVVEREIDRTEVYIADEAFMCGTGAQITPITRVEHRPIGTGVMGPITQRIQDKFFDVVMGNDETYHHWLTPVYQAVRA